MKHAWNKSLRLCFEANLVEGGIVQTLTETTITVGHRANSERYCHMTNHAVSQSDKMSSRKRPADRSSVRPHASTSSSDHTV